MTETMRAVRYHEYGEPEKVLRLETIEVPEPGPSRIRIAVAAAGVAPADWAVCGGLFGSELPRGIGCDVSGTVEAVGDGVEGVSVGDRVFGTADWAHSTSAGAADQAVMDRWFPIPDGLDAVDAAALPMAVDTAHAHLSALGLLPGRTVLIHGAGTTIGFAAVQIAVLSGMRVVATAGETFAPRLRSLGAVVTDYGPGIADRVLRLNGGPVDVALDTAPVGGSLPELIRSVGGDPRRVLTISDFTAAAELGVRDTFHEDLSARVEALPEYGRHAAEGRFSIPVAATFPLEAWAQAVRLSRGGHAHGKILLVPSPAAR